MYKRIVLKISGEALTQTESTDNKKHGVIVPDTLQRTADEIIDVAKMGVEVCLVVGGGNIFRGAQAAATEGWEIERVTADYMGMLATTINALGLQDALERKGQPTRVMTAIEMKQIAEPYIRRRAVRHLEKGRVVIFACGSGNPYFSTDTAAALRGTEMDADAVMLAKNIDGVYDKDPRKHADARRYDHLTFHQVISDNLKATDITTITHCQENNLPIILFALSGRGNIHRAVLGEAIGTTIAAE